MDEIEDDYVNNRFSTVDTPIFKLQGDAKIESAEITESDNSKTIDDFDPSIGMNNERADSLR